MTVIEEVLNELNRANRNHGLFKTERDGFDILDEEVEELKKEIRHGIPYNARNEAIQVAAMAIKLVQYLDKNVLGRED